MSEPADHSTSPDDSTSKPSVIVPIVIAVSVLVVVGILAAIFLVGKDSVPKDLARSARMEFRRGNYKQAFQFAREAHKANPSNQLAIIAGESAQRMEDLDSAVEWYRKLQDEDTEEYAKGTIAQAVLCLNTGRLTEAEESFRKSLSKRPNNGQLNRWYGTLLNAEGRRWEASRYFFRAAKLAIAVVAANGGPLSEAAQNDIFMLANFEAPFEDTPLTEKALATVPNDPIPLLGRVQKQFVLDQYGPAVKDLRSVIAVHPDLLQAHASLGKGLLDSGALDAMPAWAEALPRNADTFPPLWHVRGLWAAKVGQSRAAARCFWEAVRREPNFRSANYQLGLTLVALKQVEQAKPFLDRHAKLNEYHDTTHPMYTQGPTVETLRRVMDLSEELGRLWEQLGWCNLLLQYAQREGLTAAEQQQLVTKYQTLSKQVASNPPRTLSAANPALSVDLSRFPLPDWSKSAIEKNRNQNGTAAMADLRFEDVASDLGLNFTYTNGRVRKPKGLRIFESTGGGVAVIDFDLDGWSDLYFTQGSEWPLSETEPGERDQIFRSIAGTRVANVTNESGLGDADYSQGVTVGDFNGDGFPDLYVGNLGQNKLYQNNGDGTFEEISSAIENRPNRWTTSVLAADLNADGLPDLFDANYLSGEKVFELMCGEVQRVCAPAAYASEQCDVYLNDGAGGFRNVSVSSGVAKKPGKSLGIVAADLDGSGQLSLFVTNDGIANFLFTPKGDGSKFEYLELGLERGLAFDYDASGQACMGIAADDFNGDASIDFYVTNYFEESNTLYKMLPGNLFVDHSRETNLRTPSFDALGWGTQFMDANLDGWPDLVVTNGHVDDFSHQDRPYRMRPQFYLNTGGAFVEVKPPAESNFMNKQQLGRGLARLDIDRDGRADFAVNHLDTPAAVARNATQTDGHFVTVRLVGTESARDAIGCLVTVETKGRKRTMQLMAGDGFQASNERSLNFGLADATKIDKLTVQWPSGVRDIFNDVPVDNEITIRESLGSFLTIPK